MEYVKICNYHELPHFANIYSLSTFETPTKRGCIISTSKHIYRLISRKNGIVELLNIKMKFHGNSHKGEFELQSQSSLYYKGFVYLAITCRVRKNSEYFFSLIVMKYRNEDIYIIDSTASVDLEFTPYKIFMVISN